MEFLKSIYLSLIIFKYNLLLHDDDDDDDDDDIRMIGKIII